MKRTLQTSREAASFLDGQRARGGTRLRPAFEAAYRYATDPDRPLNVVVLSDGLAEQATAAELSGLISGRPDRVRVFCIGVGNDVNRPMLEQIAKTSGGLAAFVSPEQDLAQAAAAFRRKLLRPVAADLSLTIRGAEVYDVTPQKLPDLYHGMPIRVYGRYRNAGESSVTLSANIDGRDFSQEVPIDLGDTGDANPELERMWAWHVVDELLKQADAAGRRTPQVIDEIVRLGKAYSIVTEYTSFIVLENDAEYQRWNIERRNALRIKRDRAAQATVREAFARLQDEAARKVGPAPDPVADASPKPAVRDVSAPQREAQPMPRRDRSRDFRLPTQGGGGGAIDPILLLGILGLAAAGIATVARGERQ